jgi:hypothetical protein
MLKKTTITLIVLLFAFSASAQQIVDTTRTDYTAYMGKLIMVNEFHGVNANNTAYSHIIDQIAAAAKAGDTLNLLIETSYSQAWLLNRYIHGDNREIRTPKPYIAALRNAKMPVRIIGVDFEYDKGRRAQDYIGFLNATIEDLENQGVPSTQLKEYISSLKKDSVWQEPDRKSLIAFYEAQQKVQQPTGNAYHTINELLFVLNATHYLIGRSARDSKAYSRFLETADNNNIRYRSSYNLLIHGGAHTDPSRHRNIYHHFLTKKSSPFKDNVYSVAQVYVDCISSGDYFSQTKMKGSSSIFLKESSDDKVIDHVRTTFSPRLAANTITAVSDIPDLSLVKPYKPRIISWLIQWQTE